MPASSFTISMLVDGADTFFTVSDACTSVHSGSSVLMQPHLRSPEVLPGGIEAVVGAHSVMSEKLPSVGAIRSGICQTHQETVSAHTQPPGTHTHGPGLPLELRFAAIGWTVLVCLGELLLCCTSERSTTFTSKRPELASLANKIKHNLKYSQNTGLFLVKLTDPDILSPSFVHRV